MAEDQKDRFIQYLAGQYQEEQLTRKAMELVLEDFMERLQSLEEQLASVPWNIRISLGGNVTCPTVLILINGWVSSGIHKKCYIWVLVNKVQKTAIFFYEKAPAVVGAYRLTG